MKKSVLFVLFALISVAGFSQITGWNAKVGMNVSNWTTDDMNAKVGFRVGVGTEYAFNDMWSLQPSLFFSTKGTKADNGDFMGASAKVTVNQMYLELPVMAAARFSVADNTNLVISAGPYFAYGVGGKTKATVKMQGDEAKVKFNTFGDIDKVTLEYNGQSADVSIKDLEDETGEDLSGAKGLDRFDFGLGVGVALEYNKFIVGLDGQFGLTKLQTGGGKNMNFAISVGYKFW
ncbi:porin family protein [Bacteroides faecium]|uniref:PorT family protein n=1 Tax=Bacteroides faecium TaxID=2715212 RepID=A0A6H0KT47_9BACE|nr:porin family protein [Bacteroides faecium]QIU96221.1 PorT family protein [Bacteroides faecium]